MATATSVRRPVISQFWREILKNTDSLAALLALGAHPARVFRTVTTTATITLLDDILLCNDTGASGFTVTMPKRGDAKNRQFLIKKIDANASTITLASPDAALFDGAATDIYSVAQQYNAALIACDGINWHKLAVVTP